MTKVYSLAEPPFRTIQGEGIHAGRVALFIRFAGCNLWSGHDAHRARDAERNVVACPKFCDTDFLPKLRLAEHELLSEAELARKAGVRLFVFTGGEPMLHLTESLLGGMPWRDATIAIETNGTIEVPSLFQEFISHICVSPKVPPERLRQRDGAEIKIVHPAYSVRAFDTALRARELEFKHWFVQPQAPCTGGISPDVVRDATRFILEHPEWRLSYQLHKAIGVP